jgi:GNAT superfamily N-acetyltransferase
MQAAALGVGHLQTRPLGPQDHAPALALLAAEGHQGLYLQNLISAARDHGTCVGRLYGVFAAEGLRAIAFFGDGRQFTASTSDAESATAIADLAAGDERGWRMFVGPPSVAGALGARRSIARHLELDRAQPFLGIVARARIPRHLLAGEPRLRPAVLADIDPLCAASLELNREDLGIEPHRVDHELLRQHFRNRVESGLCFVLGPPGAIECKVDVASTGVHGALIEGIYTVPNRRGRGLARRAVAALVDRLLTTHPVVGLHMAADNLAARVAYLAAGMSEIAGWRLLLLQ